MTLGRYTRRLAAFLTLTAALCAQPVPYSFQDAQAFLKDHCQGCHQGSSPAGGFDLKQTASAGSIRSEAARWSSVALRVRNGEMPPAGLPGPTAGQREQFTNWVTASVRESACAAGVMPATSGIRRLNRDEYAATVRDLLDIQVDFTSALPADGAGGEGFDNAGETLFLSPLLLEKYMKAAQFAIDSAAKEYKSRERILVARPGSGVSPEQAAREILRNFLPRAFRRPVTQDDLGQYLSLYRAVRKQGQDFEPAILFTLRAVLVSPRFLFLVEPANNSGDTRRLDAYSLASRMSYFLLGSMPDEFLTDIAAAGKLHEPAVVHELLPVLLRREQSLEFSKRFVDQWLRVRQLDTDKAPDGKLFPAWTTDEEMRSDIRLQPALFFYEVLKRDLSLLNLLDSPQTVLTRKLARHMGETIKATTDQQPQWVDLPAGSTRGGLLGMPAVLAVSSYPYRTSPVLRGAWILESILGTPPPPPPANVPALEKQASAETPKSVREMLTQHRADPACASCHSRIDPLGFALENYDFIGRWRDEDAGKLIDNHGELPDGSSVAGPQSLKAALLDRKDLFVRNLTAKMLGYALGRGLTIQDSCTVDRIVAQLKENDYRAQKLIELIVLSMPFQYQPPVTGRSKRGKTVNTRRMNISRRTLLRGAGVSLGLPWLEAMMPSSARAQSATPRNPVRMAMLYMPNGVNTAHWYPEGVGRDFKLSATLQPLNGLNDEILVLSNLWNAAAKGGDGHYCKESAILTCATIKKTPGVDLANGTSMDQLAAQRLGEHTPLPSLELGIAPVAVGVDLAVGYTRIYGSYISWSNANTPLAREVNPRGVYERLYRAGTAQNGDAAKLDTLLLDRVLGDAKRLRAEVGAADGARLDEYLSTMRSIEQRVQRASNGEKREWKPRVQLKLEAAPSEQPGSHEEHCRLMLDMIATAFQSDTTRISTFMFGNAVSNVSFRFLEGVSLGHHDTSHHGKAEDKLRQYQLVNRWHVAQYAYLLRKLQSMKEGESTVLDNSMILFGSALSDGDSHSPHKLPLILGGRGGGRIDAGQHLKYTEDTPLANLYVSMLDAFGAPVERFADSTGPLPGVLV